MRRFGTRSRHRVRALRVALPALLVVGGPLSGRGAAAPLFRRCPRAELCFELEITRRPSHAEAGVVAIVPDGGLLPRWPSPTVFDAEGASLASECLWHNPAEGLGVVFRAPERKAGKRVFLYVRGSTWSRPKGIEHMSFKPGLLLLTAHSPQASMPAARRMAEDLPPAAHASMGLAPNIWYAHNPFGSNDQYMSYFRGYLDLRVSGSYYFATISDDGSECLIDGKRVAEWVGRHSRDSGQRGEHGKRLSLSRGLHLVEYFHFEADGDQEAQLVWRPPDHPSDRPLPVAVPAKAFLHSGECRIVGAHSPRGAPVACFDPHLSAYTWMGEQPLYVMRLSPLWPVPDEARTRYVWTVNRGVPQRGRELPWIASAGVPPVVQLEAHGPGGKTTYRRRLVPGGSRLHRVSINKDAERRLCAQALLAMCRAVPQAGRPCLGWTRDVWAVLRDCVDPFRDLELLSEAFERSYQDVCSLPPVDRHRIEDGFVEALRCRDAERGAAWLKRMAEDERDAGRQAHWTLLTVEHLILDRGELQKAADLLDALAPHAERLPAEQRARLLVRRGDLAVMDDRVQDGARLYAQAVQSPAIATPTREDWRQEIARVTAFYDQVNNLLAQNSLFAAWRTLRRWELDDPLANVAGALPLARARYLVAAGDLHRAINVLRPYRRRVEMSNFLPGALELELRCLVGQKRHREARELCAYTIDLLPKQAVALTAEAYLKSGALPE